MFRWKGWQTGKRFVTEATLIYSSRCSDSINVSRDVTFRQHLKRLLRALILSCLIVCWISYDKQTRVVVGGERGVGWSGGLRRGMHSATRPALPPDPDAFANYLFVYFRGLQNVTLELRSRLSLQTSRIAGLLHWNWLIWGELFHPPLSLVCLLAQKNAYPPLERHWTDAAGLLWTI